MKPAKSIGIGMIIETNGLNKALHLFNKYSFEFLMWTKRFTKVLGYKVEQEGCDPQLHGVNIVMEDIN